MASNLRSISATASRPRARAIPKRVAIAVVAFWRARAHRREVTDLLRLDDRMLKDIGLVRSDVLGALAEPAGADPSIGLRLRSVENRLRQNDRSAHADRVTRQSRRTNDLQAAA
jgi:uncharacterized protein YjiS (DUF1127 family)